MIAILGGGISGLSAAYELKKAGKDFILLEASDALGGKIQSTQLGDYTVEHGPNTVLVNNEAIQTLIQELGLWEELIFPEENAVQNRFVLKNHRIEPFPNSFKTAIQSRLFGFSTLSSIVKELFRPAKTEEREESLAEFTRRRFGQQIYEDFITPFVTGIYAGDPEKMSVDYTLNILKDAEQQHGSVLKGMVQLMKEKKAYYERLGIPKQKIFTFKQGLQRLIKAIENHIRENVELQTKVQKVNKVAGEYHITIQKSGTEEVIKASHIVCCLPAPATAKAFQELSPNLALQLQKINYVPAVAVYFGFSTQQIKFRQPAFGILSRQAEKVPFLGILFNSRFFPHTAAEGKELLSVICGGSRYPELIEKDDESILAEVEASVRELLGITGEIELRHMVRWPKGIPQYELGYAAIEKAIENFQEEQQHIYFSANYYKGISVSDCIQNARSVAASILE